MNTVFPVQNNMTIDRWLGMYIALGLCHSMEDFNNIFQLQFDLRNNETFTDFRQEMMDYINIQIRHLRAPAAVAA